MKAVFIVITLLPVIAASFASAVKLSYSSVLWSKTYGEIGGVANCLILTSDGGYAMAGSTTVSGNSSSYLVKTDANGDMLWDKVLGAYGTFPISIIQTSDGGYAFGCGGFNTDNLWKIDPNGTIQWSKSYNATIHCVVQTNDGGFALAGADTRTGATDLDFCLIKTDVNGDMQWSKRYGGDTNDEAFSMIQTADGGYILAGGTSNRAYFWVIKTDAAGNTLWTRTSNQDSNYGTCVEYARQVIETNDGGCAVIGFEMNVISHTDFLLVKINSSGYTQWFHTYGSLWDDEGFSVVRTGDGGYAMAGSTTVSGKSGSYFAFVRADASGDQSQFFNTFGEGCACSIVQTPGGGYAMAGCAGSDSPVILLAITDATGLPEFPSFVLLPLIFTLAGAIVISTKRARKKSVPRASVKSQGISLD
jgi:hypothetical protein